MAIYCLATITHTLCASNIRSEHLTLFKVCPGLQRTALWCYNHWVRSLKTATGGPCVLKSQVDHVLVTVSLWYRISSNSLQSLHYMIEHSCSGITLDQPSVRGRKDKPESLVDTLQHKGAESQPNRIVMCTAPTILTIQLINRLLGLFNKPPAAQTNKCMQHQFRPPLALQRHIFCRQVW